MFRRLYAGAASFVFKSTIVLSSGITLFAGYEIVTLNEKFYRTQLMPALHLVMDGEVAHKWGVQMAKLGLLTSSATNLMEYPELKSTVFDREFVNPIGLAAGFDKNGEAIDNLRRCGFGFVEIGSITPLPQPGNPPPRVFRLPEDKAVINSYGFNNDGVGVVHERVRKARKNVDESTAKVLLGVNLGKNKTTVEAQNDYEIGAAYFAPICDYLVVNVSSPNTPGLRVLQSHNELVKILRTVQKSIARVTEFDGDHREWKRPKILLKIAPDLLDMDMKDIAKVCLDKQNGVDGLIISNTTVARPSTLKSPLADNIGGLSGAPLRHLSTDCIAQMYRLTDGKVPIIGCGGVSSGEEAYEKIVAGASLVQLYTALVYQGFPVVGRVKRELAECLRRDGFADIAEAIGAAHRNDPRITSGGKF